MFPLYTYSVETLQLLDCGQHIRGRFNVSCRNTSLTALSPATKFDASESTTTCLPDVLMRGLALEPLGAAPEGHLEYVWFGLRCGLAGILSETRQLSSH
jgi:hypothetical protein